MHTFIYNFLYYMMGEVIDKKFHTLITELSSATLTVDALFTLHTAFLDQVLSECLLTNSALLKCLLRILVTAIHFSDSNATFMPKDDAHGLHTVQRMNDDADSDVSVASKKKKAKKLEAGSEGEHTRRLIALRQSRVNHNNHLLQQTGTNEKWRKMIKDFERDFDDNVHTCTIIVIH